MTKEVEILRSVVIHYIKDETPIGSAQLQREFNLDISSATIRNYFKKLVVSGMLEQIHSSSGRIPSNSALVTYWIEELLKYDSIYLKGLSILSKMADYFGLYVFLVSKEKNNLVKIQNINDEFLIVVFDNAKVCVPYTKRIEKFLEEFYKFDIYELLKISDEFRVDSLHYAIKEVLKNSFYHFNKTALIELAYNNKSWSKKFFSSFYNGDIENYLNNGVDTSMVPFGSLSYKQDCFLDDKKYKIVCIGNTTKDFGNFLKNIGGANG